MYCTLDEVTNNGNFRFHFTLNVIGFNDSGVVKIEQQYE